MRILLTGATGQVGGHLVWRLWRDGHEVQALVRPERLRQWDAHLQRIQSLFGPVDSPAPTPRPVSGHLWMERGGVSSIWIATHRGRIDTVVHAAADTRFHPVRVGDQARTNVDGSMGVAALAEALGARHLIHLSTLFVGGDHPDPFTEHDLDRNQRFRCAYERSKWEAERQLRQWAERSPVKLTVIRPGIVLGCHESGATLTFPHFYGFLRSLHRFLQLRYPGDTLTVPLSPDVTLPIVCADAISNVVTALCATPPPNDTPDTCHLFTQHGPSLAELCAVLGAGEDVIRLDANARENEIKPPPSARTLWAWVLAHRPYLSVPGDFRNEATLAWARAKGIALPQIGTTEIQRLHDFWLRETEAAPLGAHVS